MPFKAQTDCYRTINGEKWFNLCDVLALQHEMLIDRIKKQKLKHRIIRHPDGYKQVFMLKSEMDKIDYTDIPDYL